MNETIDPHRVEKLDQSGADVTTVQQFGRWDHAPGSGACRHHQVPHHRDVHRHLVSHEVARHGLSAGFTVPDGRYRRFAGPFKAVEQASLDGTVTAGNASGMPPSSWAGTSVNTHPVGATGAIPDRATFEFVTHDGELRVRWRRIGDHNVSKNP